MDYQLRNLPITLRMRTLRNRVACFLSLFLLAASTATAASINYGDFTGTSVMYLDVTESSATDPVPLYDTPSISGNLLDFDPKTFSANAGGGSVDFTDGQLNYTAMGVPGAAISDIIITEGGDYTLAGAGPGLVGYGIGLRVTVVEIDGVAVPIPFDLVDDASGTKALPADMGIGAPWALSLDFDVPVELVGQAGFTFGSVYTPGSTDFLFGVTKAEVAIDDTLFAISGPSNVALIAKKNFTILTPTEPFDPNIIPEPTTLVLAGFGLVGLMVRRKAS